MNIEMRFWMVTEDDDEPLTDKQWKQELEKIVSDISDYINKTHKTYVKDADGEFVSDTDGQFVYEPKRDSDE